jgi:hypothetical protein
LEGKKGNNMGKMEKKGYIRLEAVFSGRNANTTRNKKNR